MDLIQWISGSFCLPEGTYKYQVKSLKKNFYDFHYFLYHISSAIDWSEP